MSVIDLDLARIEREQDNTKVSVEDLLRYALKDVVNEKSSKPLSAIICIVSAEPDGRHTVTGYRCNLSRCEEIGYLDMFKAQQLAKWQAT